MDQINRLQLMKIEFRTVPDVYLFHMDTDTISQEVAVVSAQESTSRHSGRLLCELSNHDGMGSKYGAAEVALQFAC